MNILGIIPARAGSRGVPQKNIRELLDKPVISYTIEAALNAKKLDKIAISTDDPFIKEISQDYNVDLVERPEHLANHLSKIDDAMRHCCVKLAETQSYIPDIVVLLYANIPVRAEGIIDKTINKLIETDADSAQTMSPVGKFHPYWLYQLDDDKANVYIENNIYQRQNLPPLYSIDGAVCAVKYQTLMESAESDNPHAFLGTDRRGVMQEAHETVDIDSLRDFYLAEAIIREKADKNLHTHSIKSFV